jgi:hypothetical protein
METSGLSKSGYSQSTTFFSNTPHALKNKVDQKLGCKSYSSSNMSDIAVFYYMTIYLLS